MIECLGDGDSFVLAILQTILNEFLGLIRHFERGAISKLNLISLEDEALLHNVILGSPVSEGSLSVQELIKYYSYGPNIDFIRYFGIAFECFRW